MTFCIKKFSTWFCFVYSTKESSLELDSGSLCQLPINVNRFKEIIHILCDMYKDEFKPFLEYLFSDENFSYLMFMGLILSRCVQLSTTPSYLQFLLVCTLIYFLISEKFDQKGECFTLVHFTSQCLLAVYDRFYKDFFECGPFQSFYIDLNYKLAQRSNAQDRKTLSPFNQQNLIELMNNFERIDGRDFDYTEYEHELFLESLERLPDKDSDYDLEESASVSDSDEELAKENATEPAPKAVATYSKDETIPNDFKTDTKEETFQNHFKTDAKEETLQHDSETDGKVKTQLTKHYSETDRTFSKQASSTDDFESDETSSREENMYESTGGLKTDKEFFKYTNQPCSICQSKCFQFAFSHVTNVFLKNES